MKILNLLYPERCPVCDTVIPFGRRGFCVECAAHPALIKEPVCMKCGRPIEKQKEYCEDCEGTKRNYDGGRFAFSYTSVSAGVYRFKYMNRRAYAKTYARVINDELDGWIRSLNAKALIPVPLHKKRLIARGYNQSKILADEISALTGIPVADKCVERVINTAPQKLFNRKQRLINVKKAFIVRENVVKLDTVIIVDDIFTTGSTIDSLAGVLKKSGVKRVYFLTVTAAGT
ncbi:MAG: ComF family protein [Lachnospiraceae bacterium]|nr:ComF family protein [Lachnospiraceae bacterium]